MKYLYILLLTAFVYQSCTKMDSTYNHFLKDGPIIYSEKVDSLKVHAGRNRAVISWRPILDPRVTKVKISWNDKKDFLEVPITSPNDTTALISGLTEGNYVFEFFSYDNAGNQSIRSEAAGKVYDNIYEMGLLLRDTTTILMSNNNLNVRLKDLPPSFVEYEVQELRYTSSATGSEKKIVLDKTGFQFDLQDYAGGSFKFRTGYRPSALSPDTFYTPFKTVYTPNEPMLLYPTNGLANVSCAPQFTWYNSALLTGATYSIYISKNADLSGATAVTVNTFQQYTPTAILDANTKYYWKIRGAVGANIKESPIFNFTTGAKTLYADGEAIRMQAATAGFTPIRLIFTGDGFDQSENYYNKAFDTYIGEAIEAFFSVEPFKSYRTYFEVWKVAAYSANSGITESDKGKTITTVFNSKFAGDTINTTANSVYNYAKKVTGVTDALLPNTPVIVILNRKRAGGHAVFPTNGTTRSIALVPTFKNPDASAYNSFKDQIIRWGGGATFGLLADEKAPNNSQLSGATLTKLLGEWSIGRSRNVDTASVSSRTRWSHFVGLQGYDRVGAFDGAYGFRGAYRCEEASAMSTGINYFNAYSRELIVRRIMTLAGETFTFEKFLQKDISKSPYN